MIVRIGERTSLSARKRAATGESAMAPFDVGIESGFSTGDAPACQLVMAAGTDDREPTESE
jgi:hypothetical protein